MHYKVLCNTLFKTNDFLKVKVKIVLFFAKSIRKEKSPYRNAFDKKI